MIDKSGGKIKKKTLGLSLQSTLIIKIKIKKRKELRTQKCIMKRETKVGN